MSILNTLVSSLACPECYECRTLFIDEQYEQRKGLASYVSINCSSCHYINESYTSQTICTSKIRGAKPMEINYRAVYAARTVGQGYSGLEKLCGMLNLPRPMTHKNFDVISRILGESAKETAKASMISAVNNLRLREGASNDKLVDIGVSIDGTWH